MPRRLLTRKGRTWLHGIGLAALPLLVLAGWLTEESAALWVALLGAILIPGVALKDSTGEPEHNRQVWQDGYESARRLHRRGLDDNVETNPYTTDKRKVKK